MNSHAIQTGGFIPSPEQQAIFDAVLGGSRNVAISALAGTGKTTSLVQLAKQLPKQGNKVFAAFNKDIVTELEARLNGTGMYAKTFHSLGRGTLCTSIGTRDPKTIGQKYRDLAREWADSSVELRDAIMAECDGMPDAERIEFARDLRKDAVKITYDTLNFVRYKLIDWKDPDLTLDMMLRLGFDQEVNDSAEICSVIANATRGLMMEGERMVRDDKVIDFTDMIYWPVKWDLHVTPYMWVFVDECQDLSPMQRKMIAKTVNPKGGRIVLVGDPNQAIYAFAGADSDSFELSVKEWNCQVMPLNTTRRCAAIVTLHSANLVPAFVCPPEKPRGMVVWWDEKKATKVLEPGDLVVCRLKGPVVALCIDLLGVGKAATILGADLAASLIAVLEKLEGRNDFAFDRLPEIIDSYENAQVERFLKKFDEAAAEFVRDTCAALRVLVERAVDQGMRDMAGLKYSIEGIFSKDKKDNVITLATVHKSKGLEAKRVFILKPDKLPLNFPGMSAEGRRQEINLDYVARTRAKDTLVYLTNSAWNKEHALPPYAQADFEPRASWPMDENAKFRRSIAGPFAPEALNAYNDDLDDDDDLINGFFGMNVIVADGANEANVPMTPAPMLQLPAPVVEPEPAAATAPESDVVDGDFVEIDPEPVKEIEIKPVPVPPLTGILNTDLNARKKFEQRTPVIGQKPAPPVAVSDTASPPAPAPAPEPVQIPMFGPALDNHAKRFFDLLNLLDEEQLDTFIELAHLFKAMKAAQKKNVGVTPR